MKIQTRVARFATAGVGVGVILLAACTGDLTGRGDARSGELQLDLRPLQSEVRGSRSVVERIVLEVEPFEAPVQRFERALQARQSAVSLPITVLEGEVRFSVEILSNNATVLFAGETRTQVRQDGFSISIPLTQRAPFLVVEPDTVDLVSVGGDFYLRSWGTNTQLGDLDWELERVTPVLDSCGGDPCLVVGDRSGAIAGGGTHRFHFGRLAAPAGSRYTLRFTTPSGYVEVVVVVP